MRGILTPVSSTPALKMSHYGIQQAAGAAPLALPTRDFSTAEAQRGTAHASRWRG
jgi:hypothetical protein